MLTEMTQLLYDNKEFFLKLSGEHVAIAAVSVIIAVLAGGALGIFISEYRGTSKAVLGIINFLYTIPSISMLGFLIPLSGIGNTTAVIALSLYALLPMVRNTYTGLTNVEETIIEAARGMGSSNMQILFRIRLPLAMPVIFSGIRSMAVMTIALAGIASFIGAGGLGVAIYRGITTNNAAMTVIGSLLAAVLALLSDFLLGVVERRLKKRGRKRQRSPIGRAKKKAGQAQEENAVQVWEERKGARRKTWAAAICVVLAAALGITAFVKHAAGTEDKTIHIATKPMTEQYILGEMLKLLIEENTDLEVEITQGVGGGTSNIQPAMEKGEFDMYPEYTGTGWNMVLKRQEFYTEDSFDELQQSYREDYGMQWEGMYGFANTYAIAVRKEAADKYGLETISDLQAAAPELTLGAEYDFYEREDGYTPMCETYGLNFKGTVDLDIGLKYEAINSGTIDVMPIFTTDGQYSVSNIVVLEDDRQFYPSYQCGNVVRSEVLQEHPELSDIFEMTEEILTDKEMAALNYEVEVGKAEPKEAAADFLREKGLL